MLKACRPVELAMYTIPLAMIGVWKRWTVPSPGLAHSCRKEEQYVMLLPLLLLLLCSAGQISAALSGARALVAQ